MRIEHFATTRETEANRKHLTEWCPSGHSPRVMLPAPGFLKSPVGVLRKLTNPATLDHGEGA